MKSPRIFLELYSPRKISHSRSKTERIRVSESSKSGSGVRHLEFSLTGCGGGDWAKSYSLSSKRYV